ncbi:MAG: hypothetical protein ACOH10_07765 [Rhodoglobus sp.]
MAEMSPPQEVGSAMWGGLRFEDAGEPRATTAPEAAEPQNRVPLTLSRPLLSLLLVIIATLLLATGAAMVLGPGGALLAVGAVILVVGLMLGIGGEDA